STDAPASCCGRATTCPASLMSKYFAPQRWMLYRERAAWMSQDSLASVGLLINLVETDAHYRRMRREFNRLNENFANRRRCLWGNPPCAGLAVFILMVHSAAGNHSKKRSSKAMRLTNAVFCPVVLMVCLCAREARADTLAVTNLNTRFAGFVS